MKVVVIGATGHIGTYLIPRLVRAGHETIAVSRGERQPYHEAGEWQSVQHVHADRIREDENNSFAPRIAALGADIVVDLICFTAESAVQMVESLRGRVTLFVHCGTLWVHGVPRTRPYDETAPREPFGEYGIRKAEIERLLLDSAATGFPATVLHPGHITGPGWNPINPVGNLDMSVFERLRKGEVVTLPDDGEATLQHVHADDVAEAFALAIANPAASIGQAFHVASRLPITMRKYAETAASWSGREANLAYLPWDDWQETVSERDAAITYDHLRHSPYASIAKAERLLGFSPRYTATEAVRDALQGRAG